MTIPGVYESPLDLCLSPLYTAGDPEPRPSRATREPFPSEGHTHILCFLERMLHRFGAHCVSLEMEANSELGPDSHLKHGESDAEVQGLF